MKSRQQRAKRKRIYHRASAIARDIRNADFPDAVNIVARLIAGQMTRKRQPPPAVLTSPDVDALAPAAREPWRKANPSLVMVKEKESTRWVRCDRECPQFGACWPGCCKVIDDEHGADIDGAGH